MSSLCGWIGHPGEPEEMERIVRSMGRCMDRPHTGALKFVVGASSALCIDGRKPGGSLCKHDGALAAVNGDYRWTDAELADVAIKQGSATALLQGFERHGNDVFTHLAGAFNAAIVRESAGQLQIATDRVGIKPMAYVTAGDTLIFGPDAATLNRHPCVVSQVNPQAIFDYIYFHVIPAPESIYQNVHKLLPGQYLEMKGGATAARRYWQVEYDESAAGRSFKDLQQELIELVRSSVRGLAEGGAVGAFLSGGVDSSTITGVLSEVRDAPPRTYSIGFDVDEYNEMHFARLAAKHFGAKHREYFVTPDDIIESIPRIAGHYAEPFGNSSAVPTYLCARMAREDGIETLLGGDGGDELFGGNERYAKQKIFAAYAKIPSLLRQGVLEPLFVSAGFGRGVPGLNKVRRYIEQAIIPMPERLQTYNFLNFFGAEHIFSDSFLEQVSRQHPLDMLRSDYGEVKADSIVDKMLGHDLKLTLADNDLVKVGRACKLAGVDVAYPLLSDELLAFSATLPPRLKVKGQVLRYFFKKSYEGFLPDETLRKSKHGFGLPFGEWAVTHPALRSFVGDNLAALKNRGLIRKSFIDTVLTSSLAEYPQYHGTIIWLLLMLEQWHVQHQENLGTGTRARN